MFLFFDFDENRSDLDEDCKNIVIVRSPPPHWVALIASINKTIYQHHLNLLHILKKVYRMVRLFINNLIKSRCYTSPKKTESQIDLYQIH